MRCLYVLCTQNIPLIKAFCGRVLHKQSRCTELERHYTSNQGMYVYDDRKLRK